MMRFADLALVVVVSFSTALTGLGQGSVYTSRAAFNAALDSSATLTFEEYPVGPFDFPLLSALTTQGVTFSNLYPRLMIADWAPDGIHPPPSGKYLWNYDGSAPIQILLPAGVNAFGADFTGGIPPRGFTNASLTAHLANGQSYTYPLAASATAAQWQFLGLVFSSPIHRLTYLDDPMSMFGLHEEALDNVTFGRAIPEPNTLSLFGLAALNWLVGRARRLVRAR